MSSSDSKNYFASGNMLFTSFHCKLSLMSHDVSWYLICQVLKLPTMLAIGGYCLHTLVGSPAETFKAKTDDERSTLFNNIQQCDMMRHEPEKHHFKVSNLCHASATCIRNMHPCFMVFLARPDHPQLLPASRCKSQCFTNCERLSICCGNVCQVCQVCQGPTPFPSHVPPARPRCFITVTLRLHMLHFIIFISWN